MGEREWDTSGSKSGRRIMGVRVEVREWGKDSGSKRSKKAKK